MTEKTEIIKAFTQAVEPQVEQLQQIAKNMGDQIAVIIESDPTVKGWLLPQAEIMHVVNNVLAFLPLTEMGEFELPAKRMKDYIERLRHTEDQLDVGVRPSALFAEIKTKIDATLVAHPGMFPPSTPSP